MRLHGHSLLELQEQINRAFHEARAWRRSPATRAQFEPPADVSRDETAYHVRLDLPGVARDDVRLWADAGALVVRGRKAPRGDAPGVRLRAERRFGEFTRVIPLPSDADSARITARLKDGMLDITVARVPRGAPPRIEVAVE